MKFLGFVLVILFATSGCGSAKPQVATSPSPSSASAVEWKAPTELVERLRAHVEMLAVTIGPRNIERPERYAQAAEYLSESLTAMGYQVQRQVYTVDGHASVNLWVQRLAGPEVLLVGAHYDTLSGDTPGADDNASGCAALLELARALKDSKEGPTVRFVFFANEEPPYFMSEDMGSLVYARSLQKAEQKLLGMISLESIGFYSEASESQHFPPGITGYPDRGNFVGFVSDLSSKAFMERCLQGFQEAKTLPAEGLAAPSMVEGISWSDHWSFSKCGYPALMITDTAPFRNPHYHRSSDTADTLDYSKLAAVVVGVEHLVTGLQAGQTPDR